MVGIFDSLSRFNPSYERRTHVNFLVFSAIIVLMAVYFTYTFITSQYVGEVFNDYFTYAEALFNGVRPYEPYNDLRWEYPPLAYLFMVIPRFFTSDPYTYTLIYIFMMLLVTLLGLHIVRVMSLECGRNARMMMLLYTMVVIFLPTFFFDRFDVVVAVLTIYAVYSYTRGHHFLSTSMLVLGMFIKIYPGILFLFFIIPMLADRRWKSFFKSVLTFFGLSILLLIPFVILSPDTFLSFVSYNCNRGIQLESFAASIGLMFAMFGFISLLTTYSYGSFNLEGGMMDTLSSLSFPIIGIAVLLLLLAFYVLCRYSNGVDYGHRVMPAVSFVVILVFILANKVFSAQYMLWIAGLFIPAMIFCCNHKDSLIYSILFLTSIIDTSLIVSMYTSLCYHDVPTVLLLFIRNLSLLLLLILMIVRSSSWKRFNNWIVCKVSRTNL